LQGAVYDRPLVGMLVRVLVEITPVETEKARKEQDCDQQKRSSIARPERGALVIYDFVLDFLDPIGVVREGQIEAPERLPRGYAGALRPTVAE
jgi:hypothetical protein